MPNEAIGTDGRKRMTYPACSDGYETPTARDENGLYIMTIRPGAPTVTYYTSDERAPGWQLAVYSDRSDLTTQEVESGRWCPTDVHLILGDMPYHSIPKDLIQTGLLRADQSDYLREFAQVYDETDAEQEIYELLETYLELLDPNDLIPEVQEAL